MTQTKREVLRDLETRLDSAIRNLDLVREQTRDAAERKRLLGKQQGVALALSYVREVER